MKDDNFPTALGIDLIFEGYLEHFISFIVELFLTDLSFRLGRLIIQQSQMISELRDFLIIPISQ